MKQVTRIETFDGALHTDTKGAKRHLDGLYSSMISLLSHRLNHKSFVDVGEILDSNLDSFIQLKTIRDDLESFEGLDD